MIAWGLRHSPGANFRTLALKILQNHFRELDVLGPPLRLRKNDPIQRTPRALFERHRQKWLRMPDKSDLCGRESQAFPNQTHQPVAVRPAFRITVPAGGEDEAGMLQCARIGRNGARYLVRETIDEQGMPGVNVVVMQGDFGMCPTGLSNGVAQSLTLHKIEIERDG
jgi:hypothetical protein